MEYAAIFPETLALVKRYPKEQRYNLLEAMAQYAFDGSEPEWPEDALEWYCWEGLRQQVDRARSKSAQNKANGSKGKRNEANESEQKRNEANESEAERTEAKPTYKKEKEKEKEIDDDATACAREDTPFGPIEVDPVIVALQSELQGLTPSHYEELEDYREKLPDDLVIEAVNEAVAHGARTWAYVRSVLQGYIKDQIRTVGEARQRSERRKQQGPPGKRVTAQMYTQRRYSEAELETRTEDL